VKSKNIQDQKTASQKNASVILPAPANVIRDSDELAARIVPRLGRRKRFGFRGK
jgi:hypothetical protein